MRFNGWTESSMFQYMLLLRGATPLLYQITMHLLVSIHAPLARSNPWYSPSCRRGDSFNTCSSCEEQLRLQRLGSNGTFVSIHAPLARSNSSAVAVAVGVPFQYMLLLRGATCNATRFRSIRIRLNTCSSCEEQLFGK